MSSAALSDDNAPARVRSTDIIGGELDHTGARGSQRLRDFAREIVGFNGNPGRFGLPGFTCASQSINSRAFFSTVS
jgi:hypothetical protein